MSKELVVSSTRHETRVALLEDDQVTEIYYQREKEYSLAGSIHKGRVTRVLPGMQSAFVDIGLERDAFLYVSDFFEDNDEYEGRHEGLETVVELLKRSPQTPLVILSGVFDEAILQNTPEIPQNLSVHDKVQWNQSEFEHLIERLLGTQAENNMLTDAEYNSLSEDEKVVSSGFTGPLSTGLIPPPSQSQLARLDDFLAFREAAKRAAPRVTAASSSSALH